MRDMITDLLHEFRRHKDLADRAMAALSDEAFFHRLGEQVNPVALIVKHLAGNLASRWTDFLTTDGEKPDRQRDTEFEIGSGTTRAEVLRWWESGWKCVLESVGALAPQDLMRKVTIRSEPHTVVEAINRQLTHYAGHVAQIVLLAKHLRGADWKTLSIPRGQSEQFNARLGKR